MSDFTTPEGRAELRKLAETATPGPWHWDDHRVPTLYGRGGELGVYVWEAEVLEASHNGECGCRAACMLELEVAPSDAEFIAAARTAVPALLDALDDIRDYATGQRDLAERYHNAAMPHMGRIHDDVAATLERILDGAQ